ncbi:hypothetical protein [Roseivirga pacifica]
MKSNLLHLSIIIIAFTSGCISTTKIKKKYSLGLLLEPKQKVMLVWSHEDEYPVSANLAEMMRSQFTEKNIELINYHARTTRNALYGNTYIKYDSIPYQRAATLGIDYIIKASIIDASNLAGWTSYMDKGPYDVMEPIPESTNTNLLIDVISVSEVTTFLQLEAKSGYLLLGLPTGDESGTWYIGDGSLSGSFYHAMQKVTKKLLKSYFRDY